ncbi:MAG: NAD(P)-dependent oxidoreductase [Patescibacteria group bacterium]|nr:NAD(P)-dependent oxidoreductase [Patescibacteria group bacterium]
MKKILLLGSDGNLGDQLVNEFSNFPDFKVIGYTKKDLNLTEFDLIIPKISKIKPDIIINTAAYNNVDKCEEFEDEFKLAHKINGEALRYLGKAAIKNDSILVHYSTDYVFGGDVCQEEGCGAECLLNFKEKGGFREDDERCPINKYGLTKMSGEIELQRLANKKLKYYIIRTSKLFGPKGKSQDSKENFFDLMLKIANERKEIAVVSEELSCFTYTPDLAKRTREILEEKKDFGFYHVRNNDPAIWYDAARELFRLKKIGVRVKPVLSDKFPRPAKRPKYSVLANTKLPELRSWKEALKEYIKINL